MSKLVDESGKYIGPLSVGGDLDLRNTKITELPDNLSVGRSLYLRNTGITELPDNLSVGGDLDLRNTKITELPDNLSVGRSLYLGQWSMRYSSETGLFHIGCKDKTIKEWDEWFAGDEEYETKRGTDEFKKIEWAYGVVKDWLKRKGII